MPQTSVVITVWSPPGNQQSNISAGVNTGATVPGIPGDMPGALAGDGSAAVFTATPWLGAPIIFG